MDYEEPKKRDEPGTEIDRIAFAVLCAAVEVHKILGPGFMEAVYDEALGVELDRCGVSFIRQPPIPIEYKGRIVGEARPDYLVAGRLVVELKTADRFAPIHLAQALSYLKATRLPLALVINFNVPVLLQGVRRVVLST